jgi:nucleoside-diphosphate-sugar epimerase
MSLSTRSILVSGATGKQGGALIKSLLSFQKPDAPSFQILALTRNSSSPSARRLASMPNVTVIEGNLNDCAAIFAAIPSQHKPVWGVFSVQVPVAGPFADHNIEVRQGQSLIDTAIANGVQHFVYASADRGGLEKSDVDPTNIPHIATKYHIERYLKEKSAVAAKNSTNVMSWTILRPVAFFENIGVAFFNRLFVAIWRSIPSSKPLQFISSVDIGHIAALAFRSSDSLEYKNQAISIASAELNYHQANEIFKAKLPGIGNIPQTFGILGSLVRHHVKEVRTMIDWLEKVGAGASLEDTRRLYPAVMDFGTWLEKESVFKGK